MVGNPPHTLLNDHKRLRFLHDRSGRSVCGSFFVRHFHIAESRRPTACHRNTMQCPIPALESVFSASRRLARSHCEKRGESGGDSASARSGCAKSVVFCARSASAVDDTRVFSPCLTFWYFWIKPKVQRKIVADFSLRGVAALGAARTEASARKCEWLDSCVDDPRVGIRSADFSSGWKDSDLIEKCEWDLVPRSLIRIFETVKCKNRKRHGN